MKFYSTHNRDYCVSFEEAVRQGLSPDGGLFMPEKINQLPSSFWSEFRSMSFADMAFHVASAFLDSANDDKLKQTIIRTLTFDAPLVQIKENLFVLELFHGPTLAFKDFGARFLANTLGNFKEEGKNITVLVATSGDTGGAVANGFLDVPGTEVIILFPSGKVSDMQERQFTTLGKNVTAVEVEGTFDDCQNMVKRAFHDDEIKRTRNLTSANSINIARLLPQMFYYFRAFQQLQIEEGRPVYVSVPSGNFGNLTAGIMSGRMGLPVHHFIAGTNVNDIVPEYLHTGKFSPRSSVATISNAMDVGNPSNFSRILDLFGNDRNAMQKVISGYRVSEDETRVSLREMSDSGYLVDPHGAVAYSSLSRFMQNAPTQAVGIFLATAHPAKFRETVEAIVSKPVALPERLKVLSDRVKSSLKIRNDFKEMKRVLLC